ncbi:MAG: tetratricopeptide repeat protein, partial [Bacteroidia bacterium]
KIKEELKDFSGMAYSLNNIGAVYKNQGLKSKAIEYYNKSLVYFELTKNKDGVANTLNNIGVFYRDLKDPEKAMKYFKRSLEINLEIHNKQGQANAYINIGKLFSTDSINIAINYFQKAVKIYQEIGDKDGLAFALNCISDSYLKNKNTQLAQKYALEALTIGNEIGYPENIRNSAKILHETYREQKNYDRALNMYELYIHMRDSLSSQETRKASIKNQLKYEYDKKAAADSVKVAEEKKLTNLQLKQEQNQRYFLYGGLGLTLIFGGIMFNRFRITKKQKLIIEVQKLIVEKQKKAVEEKQKEVLDSIRYAKRIQQSLLPSEKYFQRILKH